ncbi:hypothetical protein ACIPUB_16665 [Paeniglutamicibacter sp. ORCA_105]|uniref:hypothetical protein n=1 Tax=Paeniglutamicibacter sp. ORCA_105 TaxID=3377336 RepID=UPI003894A352
MPPLVIDAPLDDSVAGVPDRDSGNLLDASVEALVEALVDDSLEALVEALLDDSVGSTEGETVGAVAVGDGLVGGVVSSLGVGVGLVSGVADFVGEGSGVSVGEGVALGVDVGFGEGFVSGVGSWLGFGRGDSLPGAVDLGGVVVGSGISTSMSWPFWLSVRGAPESRIGSAAMVVRRESIFGIGWPGMTGRKFRGSFQRPLMITS